MATIGWEIIVIGALIIIVLVRPKQVTEVAKSFGSALREFTRARKGETEEK